MPDIPIRSRDLSEHIDQKAHSQVRNILRKHFSSIGYRDSTVPALGEVDVVEAGTGGDDEPERWEKPYNVGGDGRASARA